MKFFLFLAAALFFAAPPFSPYGRAGALAAQDFSEEAETEDGFGFGAFDSGAEGGGFGFSGAPSGLSARIGGEVRAGFTGFFDDFESEEKLKESRLGDVFSGSLSFEASNSQALAKIKLDLAPAFDGASPVKLDEAYIRAFFGPVSVDGGLLKIKWGRADSFGPLDAVNPIDYSDMSKLHDPPRVKLARPMIRASWSPGSFSQLEAVFVPWFQGHRFAASGRWVPAQLSGLPGALAAGIAGELGRNPRTAPLLPFVAQELDEWRRGYKSEDHYRDYDNSLRYAQAGLRFSTSAGSSDLGFQYYFGRLPRPYYEIDLSRFSAALASPSPEADASLIDIAMGYNPYHQIGADFARVVAGFNLRAEAGANLTDDLDGRDGAVYNPALVWSLGFDRDIPLNINLNLQGNGLVRLFHDRIRANPLYDCEAGAGASSSRITGIVSRKFFRDTLELKAVALWGIEDGDFLVMPAAEWSLNDLSAELSGGFFGGDEKGELGQYRESGFVRLALSYVF